MAQIQPRFCPNCGATTVLNQHFCAKCGLQVAPRESEVDQQPPSIQSPSTSQYSGTPPISLPSIWTSKKRGLLVPCLVLILLVLLVLAGLIVLNLGGIIQPTITTTSLNSTVTYAGLTITVLNVQQSERLNDDPNTSTTGMVRVHLQAENKTTVPVSLRYNDIAHLVLPGGNIVVATYVMASSRVAPGTTQTGVVDFTVPTMTKVEQLILRLGAANEEQMDIPLMKNADLGKYAPVTTSLKGTLQYQGLDWVLTSATSQLSVEGQQASKGMHYVILTLSVTNTLSQTAIPGSAYDYVRLKAGNVMTMPQDTTLPVSFEAGATDKMGTVTFLVPQNATTLTFILMSQHGFDQATTDFRL